MYISPFLLGVISAMCVVRIVYFLCVLFETMRAREKKDE